jgi:hypothetical protein
MGLLSGRSPLELGGVVIWVITSAYKDCSCCIIYAAVLNTPKLTISF